MVYNGLHDRRVTQGRRRCVSPSLSRITQWYVANAHWWVIVVVVWREAHEQDLSNHPPSSASDKCQISQTSQSVVRATCLFVWRLWRPAAVLVFLQLLVQVPLVSCCNDTGNTWPSPKLPHRWKGQSDGIEYTLLCSYSLCGRFTGGIVLGTHTRYTSLV